MPLRERHVLRIKARKPRNRRQEILLEVDIFGKIEQELVLGAREALALERPQGPVDEVHDVVAELLGGATRGVDPTLASVGVRQLRAVKPEDLHLAPPRVDLCVGSAYPCTRDAGSSGTPTVRRQGWEVLLSQVATLGSIHRRFLGTIARDISEITRSRSAIVLAPHPDDETLGCGHTIHRKAASGAHVQVVVAFDGRDAWERSWDHDRTDIETYVAIRRAECIEACRRLGLHDTAVEFLGLDELPPTERALELDGRLRAIASDRAFDDVFVPHGIDAHDDHRIVAAVTAGLRSNVWRDANVYAYPIWYWLRDAWTSRQRSKVRQIADVLTGLARDSARMHPRTVHALGDASRKRDALDAHQSQLLQTTEHPHRWILDAAWAESFLGSEELFFALQEREAPPRRRWLTLRSAT